MDPFQFFSSFCLAIGLSAACGFRIFIPPLTYGIFYKANLVELSDSWSWIGNDWVILLFALATIFELMATFIPYIDNLLDIISTPVSILAGTILASSVLSDLDPSLQWILSIICGVGVTGSFQLSTVTMRGMSTFFSGGIFNPVFAFVEDILAFFIAVSTILIPSLGLIIIIGIFIFFLIKKKEFRKRKNRNKSKDIFGN